MTLQARRVPQYQPQKDREVRWDTFKGGLNTLFKPTELRPDELAQADNIMYIGRGTPTGRWGSQPYYLAGENGRVRLLDAYYNSLTSTNLLLSITDTGYLTKKNNASYTILTGASFPSGFNLQSVQLGNNVYIAAASQNFIKFDGSNLIPYVGLSVPTNVSLVQLSAASGFNTFSWVVTATSQTGETLGSALKVLASMPLDLTQTLINISWNTVSAAPSILTGYNIYRGIPGEETLVASVPPTATNYRDTGSDASQLTFVPSSDTTAGIKAKYVLKYADRLVLAGIAGDPSRVYISGRFPFHDRFSAIDGGGYTLVSPNDGDDITGLGIAGNQAIGDPIPTAALLVFKNNTVYRIGLSSITLGNFSILDFRVQLLTADSGASNGDTVLQVGNDTQYFGRKGHYSVGLQAQYLNQIRSAELSFRVRDYARGLSDLDYKEATAAYIDNKYLISFPTRREVLMYDRERNAYALWKTPFGITKWLRYFDATGTEVWLAGSDAGSSNMPYVHQMSSAFISDNGTAISKVIRTRKEDMGDWSIFKVLKLFYVLFRNIRGNVQINLRLEDRTGNTVQAKSFTIAGALGTGGWGNDQWGSQQWGQTNATVVLTGDEIARYSNVYKNCRVVQVEVSTTAANANFEFLGIRMTMQGLGDQSLPASDKFS